MSTSKTKMTETKPTATMPTATKPVHVIAEAGTNHNGSVEQGRRLVDLAAKAKADTIKFQIIDTDQLYLPGDYEFGTYNIDDVRALRRRFQLSDEQFAEIADYSSSKGLPFTASIFDEGGLRFLAGLNPPYIKIASTDLNNIRLLRAAAATGIRLIVSTGMSSLADVAKSVTELSRAGCDKLVLMHCVSVYPAQLEEMNLGFIDTLRSEFGFEVGFSDHTEGSLAACLAVTKGVSYIEKHFTYDRKAEGFDHAYASEQDNFVQYVADIRAAEAALRASEVKLNEREMYTRKRARRSLYASRDLAAGETITDADVLVVRPENIMAADSIDDLIGRTLASDLPAFSPFDPQILRS